MHIEKSIHCDLSLDEVAMIMHTFLKKQDIKYNTIVWVTEKISYDVLDEKNPERLFSNEKYTLYIIASYETLTSLQVSEIFKKLQSSSLSKRSDR